MKKVLLVVLCVVLTAGLFLTGCADDAGQAADTSASSEASESSEAPAESSEAQSESADAASPEAATSDSDFPLAGKAVDEDGNPYLMGFVGNEVFSGWMSTAVTNLENMWVKAGGEFISFISQADLTLEVSQMDDLIELAPDIIVVHPTDSYAISPAVDKARELGIPVIAVDMGVSGTEVDSYVHSDQVQMGVNVGEWVKENFSADNPALVLELAGSLDQNAPILRKQGFDSVVDELDYVTIDQTIDCQWENDLAQNAILDAFERTPEINVIFSHSDCMMQGILEGLRQKGLLKEGDDPDRIKILAVDGDSYGLQSVRDGYVDIISENNPFYNTCTVVNVALAILYDQDYPEEVVIDPPAILPENATSLDFWGNLDPADIANWDWPDAVDAFFPTPSR